MFKFRLIVSFVFMLSSTCSLPVFSEVVDLTVPPTTALFDNWCATSTPCAPTPPLSCEEVRLKMGPTEKHLKILVDIEDRVNASEKKCHIAQYYVNPDGSLYYQGTAQITILNYVASTEVCPASHTNFLDSNDDGTNDRCAPQSCGNNGLSQSSAGRPETAGSGFSIGDFVSGLLDLVGNPVSCSTGQKIQSDSVYTGTGADPLNYTTYYSSPKFGEVATPPNGNSWSHFGNRRSDNQARKLETIYQANGGKIFRVNYKNGTSHLFSGADSNTTFKGNRNRSGNLTAEADGSYTQTMPGGTTYSFNADGLLTIKTLANGKTRTYSYTPTGKLSTVTNHFGQQLKYFYNGLDLLYKIIDPEKQETFFKYDANQNLTKIIYPDSTPADLTDNPSVSYLFENADFPNHLTGKVNEKGVRLATWSYDVNGRAISSEHGVSLEKVELDYSVQNQTRVTHHVSDTLSSDIIYHYTTRYVGTSPKKQLDKYEQLTCTDCTVGSWVYGYDANGYVAKSASPTGSTTTFVHDENGFETSRTEAVDTVDEKTYTTVWDTAARRVLSVTSGNLKTEYAYDTQGQRTSTTLTDLVSLKTRTTTFTYVDAGLVSSVDGARTDVTDTTSFTYDTFGNVSTITNALGHVSTFENYDASGRVGTITDANGMISSLTYTPRGWLNTSTVNGVLTQYDYFPTGSVKQITAPNGQTINYEYDDGERLVAIVDSLGNRMEYVRDLMGNVTDTNIKDSTGVLTRTQTAVFNALGQLKQSLGNNGQSNLLTYDADGNPVTNTNAKNNATTTSFDALNRLNKTIDADLAETNFKYGDQDRLTSVTDATGKATSYEYNAFGDLTKLTSPDTGITTFTYDKASNMLTKTDARGLTVTMTYDALNRPLTQSYADSSENITYTYDETANGNKGIRRLTSVVDSSGTTSYFYNEFGLVTEETFTINGQSYQTQYHYDANGQPTGMTYPRGRTLTYTYDALGRLNEVTTSFAGETQTLASNITYLPFGPMNEVTYGNGNLLSRTFDLDYRLTDKTNSAIDDTSYLYDLTNNVVDISYSQVPAEDQSFSYDSLSRLLTGTGNYGAIDFSYDKIGNRLDKTFDSVTDNYVYAVDSHQLDLVNGNSSITNTFDASGNTITRNDVTFTYNERGRMSGASKVGMNAEYQHNFKGQRVFKQVDGLMTHYIFDLQGRLIAETDGQGAITNEYIFLNNELLSKVEYTSAVASVVQEISIDHNWSTVSFDPLGETPVVIAGPATNHDNAPGTVQLRNVADGSAEVRFAEWGYLDGVHSSENVSVMALPQGRYNMPDGSVWEIGTLDVTTDRVAFTHSFTQAFDAAPTLILTPQTANDGTPYTVRAKSVSASSFVVRMNEEELTKNTAHVTETIGYVAIYNSLSSGTADFNGVSFDYSLSSGSLKHQWKTLDGYSLKVEEEQSKDIEIYHTTETVALLLVNDLMFAQDVLTKGGDSSGIRRNTESPTVTGDVVAETNIYYYHNSHLGTPEIITDTNQTIVWQASYTPFGKATVSVNTIDNNIRFPGQYFDQETGLHYNYFRDYDPEIGRYIQSDPIGLAGGINTYGYVGGNPVNYVDPLGLHSTRAHNRLIRRFAQGLGNLPPRHIQAMNRGSAEADAMFRNWTFWGNQGDDYSFMHALTSSTNPSASATCKKTRNFIKEQLAIYDKWIDRGWGEYRAYEALGMALHPVMDSTSPAHVNYQSFSPYSRTDVSRHGPDSALGFDRPNSLEGLSDLLANPKLIEETVRKMNDIFNGGDWDCGCDE